MRKLAAEQIVLYILVSVISVGGAFLVSMKFMGGLSAQEDQAAPPVDPGQPPVDPVEPPLPPGEPPPVTSQSSSGTVAAELEGFLEPFIYDVVNRRDPFLAYSEYIPQDEVTTRPLSAAQRFSLEELKLVGVMWDVKDPKAMFIDPDKEILTLGRDDSIGNRNGYIAAIREGEVVVVEALRKRGDIIYRTKVLRIER